jgi:MFS family permease
MLPLPILLGPLGAAVALTLASQALAVAVGLNVPMYLEEVLGFDAQRTGAWNTILPLSALVFAPLAGWLSDRAGVRALTTAGLALATGGCVVLAGLGDAPEPVRLLFGLALIGAGLGLFSVPNASALLSLVPRSQLGIASGLQGTTRNLGFSSGAAFMGAMMASRYSHHAGHPMGGSGAPMSPTGFAAATRDAYAALTALAALATLLAALQPRRRGPEGAG